ncbi:hypothetical protein [Actinomadura opuntiae]|uniref:hypothetical protein n=1 Tax=Actinomadura sp. OS1-43 TaxID=604315 RepID=UPI00255B2201|nr:hypothetical protein [Actinomadura sp. OS1-43]MDL4816032.1 hypothetical protein [Actinomadura sp. OS1-43]
MNKTTISTTAGAFVLAAGALLPVSAAHATTVPRPGAPATTDPGGGNPGEPGGETPGGGGTDGPDTGAPDSGNPTDGGSPTDSGSPTMPGSESPTTPGGTPPAPGGGAPANPKATTVTVTEKEYSLKLSQTTFKPGPYIFIAKNTGSMEHALAISGPGITNAKVTPGISPGQQTKLNLSLQPGTYQLWCPIDDHRSLGMETKITVPGSGGVVPPGGPAPSGSPTQSPTGGSSVSPPESPTTSPPESPTAPPESPTGAPTGTPTGSGAPGGY